MKILILEDSPEYGRMLSRQFKSNHIMPVVAANAQEAIKLLDESNRFEVATLDHDLGALDGTTGQDVARHIVSMEKTKRPGRIYVHSRNNAGAEAILAIFKEAGVEASRVAW